LKAATTKDAGAAPRIEHGPKEGSVICTAKNAAATIERTIRSILAQDFQNWEMIIVDDGSTDDTVSIVNAFTQADPRIRLVATGGIGRGRALNRALSEAKADLIANIDADDESHPSRLRCQLKAMEQHPQFTVISTEWIEIRGGARPDWPKIDGDVSFQVADVTKSVASYNPICHSSVIMRNSDIARLGGYDEVRRLVIDYDLWVRCAVAGLRLGQMRVPLVAHRIHPDQFYRTSGRLRYLFEGARVQLRAIRALGGARVYLPLMILRLLWGVMPLRVRLGLRSLRDSWCLRQSDMR
jgi:teichuronic acid biosynthesis glycosyltransferase TuaG